jgi:hypothetical protein
LSGFNPHTLISVWVYQYRFLDVFDPWRIHGAWNVAFGMIGGWPLILVVLFFPPIMYLAWLGVAAAESDREHKSSWKVVATLALMMLGVSAVHALAGGYSAASRHQYAPLQLGLLAAGSLTTHTSVRKVVCDHMFAIVCICCAVGVATTWLVWGINRFESFRYHALIDYVTQNDITGPIQVSYEPEPWHYAPILARIIQNGYGYSDDWVFAEAQRGRSMRARLLKDGGRPLRVVSDANGSTVICAPRQCGISERR